MSRTIFVAVVVLALAKGLIWSVVLPPWLGPDEPAHYSYIQAMVEDRWLARGPDPNGGQYYAQEIDCSQINLGIGVSGPFRAEPPFGAPWITCTASSPADRHATSPLNAAGNYSPVFYAGAIPFYLLAQSQSVVIRLQAVRLWSVLLGVLAAAFAYFAARWAFSESTSLSTAAAVLFILQPMNSQQTAVVNNDALLIAVAAAFWWRFFRALRTGVSVREGLLLGGLIGLAYLAKPQGIFLAATLPVLYLVALKRLPLRTEISRLARLAGASAAPILAFIGIGQYFLVLAGNTTLLHPSAPGIHGLRQYLHDYAFNHFEHVYWLWVTGFWGYFGWFQVHLPSYVYFAITLMVIAGLLGALALALTSARLRPVLIASMLAVLIPAVLIQLVELYTFRSNGELILQGRSFLMLLFPLIVVLIRGWQRFVPKGAASSLAAAIVLAATILNLTSLFLILDAYFG
jgi:4-amino-4-deoxy-L-arabinose transferase-like glycosyltransferase